MGKRSVYSVTEKTMEVKYTSQKKSQDKSILHNTEYLRIVCRGLGLEVRPRHMWDLFINTEVRRVLSSIPGETRY
jgi:hypothetical protein